MGCCVDSRGYFHDLFSHRAYLYLSVIFSGFRSMKKLGRSLFFGSTFILGVIGIFSLGYRTYRESERNREISKEIQSLQDESNRIDQENRKLSDRIEYLQSDTFREREAKRVLDYQKAGEKVVLIREHPGVSNDSSLESSPNDAPFVLGVSNSGESNLLRWWHEFFGKGQRD